MHKEAAGRCVRGIYVNVGGDEKPIMSFTCMAGIHKFAYKACQSTLTTSIDGRIHAEVYL